MSKQEIWIGNRLSNLRPMRDEDVPEPDKHQAKAGKAMCEQKNVLLLSPPGAGKTLTALEGMLQIELKLWAEQDDPLKALLLVPSIATRNWARWITKIYELADLPCKVQIGVGNASSVHEDTTHFITTYGTISRRGSKLAKLLFAEPWDVFIADESDNLASRTSNRVEVVFGRGRGEGLAERIEWCWYLTGTLFPRYQDGIFPILFTSFPDALARCGVSNEAEFLQKFTYTKLVKYGKMQQPQEVIAGNRNTAVMHRMLFEGKPPIAYRLPKPMKDKPVFSDITLDFKPSRELEAMSEAVMEMLEVGDDGFQVVDGSMAKAFQKMGKESAPAAAKYIHEQLKAKRSKGDKRGILVLFWHTEVGELLVELLGEKHGHRVDIVDGKTYDEDADEIIREFNDGESDILIGQIKRMGVAVDLQYNCNHVMIAEGVASHAALEQAWCRVYRRGQEDVVYVDFLKNFLPICDINYSVAAKKGKDAAMILDGEKL